MRYAKYGNGRPILWLILFLFLFLGGFRVIVLMLGLIFALFPLIIFSLASTFIFQTLTKNQRIGSYLHSQTTVHNQFVELLVRLAVHVIQADGKVEVVEIQTVKNFCHTQLKFSPEALVWVDDLIHRELRQSHPVSELVAELKKIPSPGLGLLVLDLLYQIAHADFEFHAEEATILERIANVWGLTEADILLIKNRYMTKPRHASSSHEESFQTLGIPPGSSKEEIKAAYRKLVKQFHPDVVAHLGDEFKQLAEQKMKAITKAYEHLHG